MESYHLVGKSRQLLDIAIRESVHEVEITTFGVPKLPHALQESINEHGGAGLRAQSQPGNERAPCRTLRARRKRPCRCRAAEKRNELTSPHIRSQAQETAF